MFSLICDNCGASLIVNEQKTLDEYMKDANYLVDSLGKLLNKSVQQYLFYICPHCHREYKYTYKEWEKKYREKIAMEVMEIKKQVVFKTVIDPRTINADNGVEFCGLCSGYFGDGTCLIDVIKQCTIRKERNEL